MAVFFSITNPAWTGLGFNPGLGGERPASNRLSNDRTHIQSGNVRGTAGLRQVRVAVSCWRAEKTRIQNLETNTASSFCWIIWWNDKNPEGGGSILLRNVCVRTQEATLSRRQVKGKTVPTQATKGEQMDSSSQGCTNPTVAPNICEPSVRCLLHVTLLAPRILSWFLDFRKYVHSWLPHFLPSALDVGGSLTSRVGLFTPRNNPCNNSIGGCVGPHSRSGRFGE